MAVSHQWSVKWSPPAMVWSDISRQYDNVNNHWSSHSWSSQPLNSQSDITPMSDSDNYDSPSPYQPPVHFSQFSETSRYNERTRAAGLTLWLAMLGTARAQALPADTDTPPFRTLYKWNQIDFKFPCYKDRLHAISSGNYIPKNVLPLGLEIWGARVWITLPKWRPGVPATLATVPREGGISSPLLRPYPNWRLNDRRDCSGLTSVFRVNADSCGRLWVLDSGLIDTQDKPKQICPPSIAVFNLKTDILIARYIVPPKYVLQGSLFSNIIVDTQREDCSDLHAYMADTWRFGLLVFRESDKKFWRFSNAYFYPDPLASNYVLHGIKFQWSDGIFGLALSPANKFNEERTLYFHPLSSYREFSVSTVVLKNSTAVNVSYDMFQVVGDSRGRQSQSSASAIDRFGVMFYGLVLKDSIGCWDTQKPHSKKTTDIVVTSSETLVFPNDIKVDQESRQSVWVISNRLPLFQSGPLDPQEYNYRIMYADTLAAVQDSICEPSTYYSYVRLKRNHKNLKIPNP